MIALFIEKRWLKTKWMFCLSFLLYLLFLILFSTFLGLMYFRENNPLLREANKKLTRVSKKTNGGSRFFTGCSSDVNFAEPTLCSVEIFLVISLRSGKHGTGEEL